jgi:hypothetical protein
MKKPKTNPLHPEKPLVTRRDFLSSGALGFSATLMLPSVFSMVALERAARAGECPAGGAAPGAIPFLIFDCAGGASLSGNWVLSAQEGLQNKSNFTPLPSYTKLGLVDMNRFKLDDRFGAPMAAALDPTDTNLTGTNAIQSLIFAQLHAILPNGTDKVVTKDALTGVITSYGAPNGSPNYQKNLRMGIMAHTSLSDSGSNMLSAVSLVTAAGMQGTRIKNGLGTRQSVSAGNSDAAGLQAAFRPMGINSIDSLNTALGYGPAFSALPNKMKEALGNVLLKLTGIQAQSLGAMNLGDQLASLTRCGHIKNLEYTGNASTIDARTDADCQAVYGINPGSSASASNVVTATLIKAALEGSSGPAVITVGGCDYHSGQRTDGDTKDTEIGTAIANAILLAARKGVAFAFQIFTDGGIYSDDATRDWRGDDNDKSLTIFGIYDPNGPRDMLATQLGRYTAGQGADRNHFLGTDPSRVAHAVLLNYLAVCGQRARFNEVAPDSRIAPSALDGLLLFKDKV